MKFIYSFFFQTKLFFFLVLLFFSTLIFSVQPYEEEVNELDSKIKDESKSIQLIENDKKDDAFLKKLKEGGSQVKIKKREAVNILGNESENQKEVMYLKDTSFLYEYTFKDKKNRIAEAMKGEEVEVLSYVEKYDAEKKEDRYWVKIKLRSGREGFISEAMLTKKAPLIKQRAFSLYKPKDQYVIASKLNLREEPSIDGYVLALIPRNEKVSIIKYSDHTDFIDGKRAKWAFVKYGYYSKGWVFSGYLDSEKFEQDDTKEDPKHIYSGFSKYVKSKMLHVRDEPSKYGTIIGVISHRTSVEILERQTKPEEIIGVKSIWVKIQSGNIKGWVFGGFLSEHRNAYLSYDNIDKPFLYPIDPARSFISSPYGYRIHPIRHRRIFHTGIDMAAGKGVPLYAAGDGVIFRSRWTGGYGNLTVIKHDNGLYTYYGHQSRFRLREGARVKAGDIIGYVGTTGLSTGNHVHFEVRAGYRQQHFKPNDYIIIPESEIRK